MPLNIEELNKYFTGKKKRLSYGDSIYSYDYLRFHFDGPDVAWKSGYNQTNYNNTDGQSDMRDWRLDMVMMELIHARRPSETAEIWAYRKRIFECITKEVTSAVLRSLTKIKRSDDWDIRYPEGGAMPANIVEGETLQDYCEVNFPYHYKSITNWAFAIMLKNLLIDPNAVCLIMPLNEPVEANEYRKPYPIIFNSNQVIEYVYDEHAILLSVRKTEKGGNIFLVVDENEINTWEQIGSTVDYENTDTYVHGLGELPCFRLPGVFRKSYANDYLNESHISSMLPSLNECVREYSDLQAEVVMHVFSEKWEYASQKCEECFDPLLGMSTGRKTVGKKVVTCQKCNGTGLMGSAPYKKTVLSVTKKLDDQTGPLPTPPAGYIQKQIDIVKVQDERVQAHKYNALATINMQFLSETPLNQSGKAKEVDKDELNNFIYAIASDIIKAMNQIYFFANEYRYKDIIPSKAQRKKFLPNIPIPTKYDLLGPGFILEEMAKAKEAGLDGIILNAMQQEYIQKQTGVLYTEAQEIFALLLDLDPFPDITEDEKLARKTGGGITDIDYCISCNIISFVKRALDEDGKFAVAERSVQVEKMQEYAKEIVDANNLKAKAEAAQAVKVAAAAKQPGASGN